MLLGQGIFLRMRFHRRRRVQRFFVGVDLDAIRLGCRMLVVLVRVGIRLWPAASRWFLLLRPTSLPLPLLFSLLLLLLLLPNGLPFFCKLRDEIVKRFATTSERLAVPVEVRYTLVMLVHILLLPLSLKILGEVFRIFEEFLDKV